VGQLVGPVAVALAGGACLAPAGELPTSPSPAGEAPSVVSSPRPSPSFEASPLPSPVSGRVIPHVVGTLPVEALAPRTIVSFARGSPLDLVRRSLRAHLAVAPGDVADRPGPDRRELGARETRRLVRPAVSDDGKLLAVTVCDRTGRAEGYAIRLLRLADGAARDIGQGVGNAAFVPRSHRPAWLALAGPVTDPIYTLTVAMVEVEP
jgi:hypothetical protein